MNQDAISAADMQVHLGNYDQAIKLYSLALESDRLNENLLVNLSYAYLHGLRFQEGIDCLEDFLDRADLQLVSFEIYMNLALLYRSVGRLAEALGSLSRAESRGRTRVDLYIERAHIQHEMGAYDDVIDTFTEAQLECGKNWQLHNEIGTYYNDVVGEHKLAILHFTLAKGLAPGEPQIYNNLGIAQVADDDYSSAIENLSHAIKLDPDYTHAYHNLVVALYKSERYRDASEVLTECLERFPQYSSANSFSDMLNEVQGLACHDPVDLPRISREDAKSIAETFITSNGFGRGVNKVLLPEEYSGRLPYLSGVEIDNCWMAFVEKEVFGLESSHVVLVDRESGEIVFSGRVSDEG